MRRMLGRPNRSLALYIALPFVAMVLLWRAVGLWLTHDAIDRSATRAIETELLTGRRIFEQLLAQRAERLGEAARLLSSDYGFRSAIASGDTSTLQDALLNQGQRIGAVFGLAPQAVGFQQGVDEPQVGVGGGVGVLHLPLAILALPPQPGRQVEVRAPAAQVPARPRQNAIEQHRVVVRQREEQRIGLRLGGTAQVRVGVVDDPPIVLHMPLHEAMPVTPRRATGDCGRRRGAGGQRRRSGHQTEHVAPGQHGRTALLHAQPATFNRARACRRSSQPASIASSMPRPQLRTRPRAAASRTHTGNDAAPATKYRASKGPLARRSRWKSLTPVSA